MSTVAPEDEEDILHCWEVVGAAVVLHEHVALLEGVVDRGLVVRARLL
jgi:hypothetical protein